MAGLAIEVGTAFLALARTLPDGVFVADREGRIVFANDGLGRLFGAAASELIGQPLRALLPVYGRPEELAAAEQAVVQGRRPDGHEVTVEVTGGAYEQDGERYHTGVVRLHTEEEPDGWPERLERRLLDAVGEAVIATDVNGRILYWNAYAEQLYRWSAEEVVGRAVEDLAPAQMSSASRAEIMERLRQARTWTGESEVRDRHGREFPVLVTHSPVLDRDGRLVGIIAASREITDRKRSEEAQRFLAEAGRVLAWSLDHATTLSRVSRLAVPLLGDWCMVQLRQEGASEPIPVEHCTPEGAEDRADELEAALTGESGLLTRLQIGPQPARLDIDDDALTEDERSTLRSLGIRELMLVRMDARGEPVGSMAFAREDGTRPYDSEDAHLASELALRAAFAIENARLYRDAEESNRAKTDFLAVVSHELRTPLNAIAGYTDLLRGEISGPLNEKQAAQLERIKVGARHLAHLIDEILGYARVEAGGDTVDLTSVDVSEVAREAAMVLQPTADEKGLALSVDAPDAGPDLRTDAGKLRQILVNLVGNAVKYTEEGSVRVQVGPDADGAVVRVTDTGIGIPAEEHERIFEPFRQVQSPNTRTVGGTGLGLSVNRRLVDLLGGTIAVESEPGVGSTFTVRLPAQPPTPPAGPRAETTG